MTRFASLADIGSTRIRFASPTEEPLANERQGVAV